MNKFFKTVVTTISILAGVAGIIGLYLQIINHKSIIEIKTISVDKLTATPTVDGLNAIYTYKKDTVKSLWKLHYLVNNTGDEIIIGEGNNKNIIKDKISFELNEQFKILDLNFKSNNLPFKTSTIENKINLSFLQWKPQESFELIIYAEQLNGGIEPKLNTNERELINGEVNYSTIFKEIEEPSSLFDKLPKAIKTALWWIGIISFGLFLFLMPIGWLSEFTKWIKYKRWEKNDYWMYSEWMNEQVESKKAAIFYNPKNLPNYLWTEYPYIKPTFPDNNIKTLTFGVIFGIILFGIPLLLLIGI
jgi:hypothetical protein